MIKRIMVAHRGLDSERDKWLFYVPVSTFVLKSPAPVLKLLYRFMMSCASQSVSHSVAIFLTRFSFGGIFIFPFRRLAMQGESSDPLALLTLPSLPHFTLVAVLPPLPHLFAMAERAYRHDSLLLSSYSTLHALTAIIAGA